MGRAEAPDPRGRPARAEARGLGKAGRPGAADGDFRPVAVVGDGQDVGSVIGEIAERLVEALEGQADLFEVVGGLGAVGSLAGFLHGWQQHADQDGDDGHHHQ